MTQLELDEKEFINNLIAISFLNNIIHVVEKEKTVVLNMIKLTDWLNEIRKNIEDDINATKISK